MPAQPIFYVMDDDGNYVAATYLTDGNGNPIKDASWGKSYVGDDGTVSTIDSTNKYYKIYDASGNSAGVSQNTNGYLIVPADYSVQNQITAASQLATSSGPLQSIKNEFDYITYALTDGDLQHNYDSGQYGTAFVRAFTDAGAFNLGLISAAAGYDPNTTYFQAGIANLIRSGSNPSIDTNGYEGNPVRNTITIEQGYKYYQQLYPSSPSYDFSGPEQKETPQQHSENQSPYNGNPNIILTNYAGGTSSLAYSMPNPQTTDQTTFYSGSDASGAVVATTASYQDGSSASWGQSPSGQNSLTAYGPGGSVSFVASQQQNADQSATAVVANTNGAAAVTGSNIDISQVSYSGDGTFTLGSPQADPNGLVNQLTVSGTFGVASVGVTDPTTGVTSQVQLDNGSTTTLQEGRSAATDTPNEQVLTTESSGQVDDAIFGQGAQASVNNTNVTLEQGVSATVSGDNNDVAMGTGSTATIDGTSNAVALTADASDTLNLSGTTQTVTGDSGTNVVNLTGDDTSATVSGGGAVDLTGSNQTLTLGDNGETVTVGANLSGESVTGSGGTISFASGASGTVNGSDNIVDLADNAGASVALNGDGTVNGDSGTNVATVDGSGTFSVAGGGNVDVDASNVTINLQGSGGIVTVAANESGVVVDGTNYTVNEGANDGVTAQGSGYTVNGAPAAPPPSGSSSSSSGSSSSGGSSSGSSSSGGSGSSSYGGGSSGGGGSGGYYGSGGGSYGSFDFKRGAKPLSRKPAVPHTSVLTQAERAQAKSTPPTDTPSQSGIIPLKTAHTSTATQAELALERARRAEKAANNPSAARTPVFEGAKWQAGGNGKTAPTITWSFATPASGGANAFSAFIGSGYKSTVEQAIAAWAKASGINFKEVPDSATADIRIGWGDFDTAKSGVLGFTDLKERNGTFTPGTIIRLEDPSQTALIKDADGLTYAGTGATLYQVALHEIGHALGLADDSDKSSVMFASSSQANRRLDSTDVNGIDALYGLKGGVAPTSALERGSDKKAQPLDALTSPGSTAAGIHRLVQAMAAFEPRESTAFLAQVATENAAPPKLATPSHR